MAPIGLAMVKLVNHLLKRHAELSRTIADLAGTAQIETPHLAEALQYRPREIG